jgi:hypothetical protein
MTGLIAMIGVDQLCARRKSIGGSIEARIGRIRPICARDCAWLCTCADRPSQLLYMRMCTHAQNRFADTPNKQHAYYFMDIISSIPMRRDSSGELFLLLHIASNSSAHCTKNRSHVHNFAAYMNVFIGHFSRKVPRFAAFVRRCL